MARFGVILVAAGRSSRFSDAFYKKPFAPLAGRPVWQHSAERFCDREDVSRVVLVVAAEDREIFLEKFSATMAFMGMGWTVGGEERSDSVERGFNALDQDVDFVAIHDAARPCVATEWIDRVFQSAREHGAAILATPVVSTLKRVNAEGTIVETVDRAGLWEAQTPQVFRRDLLERAFALRRSNPSLASTDEACLVEALGEKVRVVKGSPINLKITSREDLRLAEQALKALPKAKLPGGPGHPFASDSPRNELPFGRS
jgi:2-C-methyl-D-erythritol 4-phosphate cytidylyltransferase